MAKPRCCRQARLLERLRPSGLARQPSVRVWGLGFRV